MSHSATEREERLGRILADYLHAVEAGAPPDRAELMKQYPELADELGSFFRNRELMERIAQPIKEQAPALVETIGLSAGANSGVGAAIRYFGDYELLEEIARGGMGVVFRARQTSLNRIVAVKMILSGQLASPADVQRFKTEAEAAAGLDHPHIVPIYEVGEHEGQHYFSMKLVEGGSLAKWIADGGKDVTQYQRQAARLLIQVARAVHHAHQRGILHRDLKPANILLQFENQQPASKSAIVNAAFASPMVTDFGLAKRVEGASDLTQSGAIVGTPSYMAPEQVRAEKQLTTAVDVYSLGAILYEMLTGRTPFQAKTPFDTLMQVLDRDPAPLRSIQNKIDADLETICLKCMQKTPERRYESAAALADDLERWLNGEPIRARPVGRMERVSKWARRHPQVAALVCALAIVCVAGFCTVFSLWRLAEERRTNADISADDAHEQQLIAQKERDLAKDRLWQSLFDQVRAERATGNRWRSLELVKEAASMKVTPELRQEAVQSATSAGFRQVCKVGPRIQFMNGDAAFFAFSSDNTLLATFDSLQVGAGAQRNLLNGVKVWRLPSGKFVAEAECDNQPGGCAFSPTEPVMALVVHGKARLWEPATGKATELFACDRPLIFSPDGDMLAASGKKGCIVWDLRQNKQLPVQAPGQPVAFVATDKLLVRDGQQLSVWNARDGKETFKSPKGWGPIAAEYYPFQITRGNSLVALRRRETQTGRETDDVEVWDVDSGKRVGGVLKAGRVSFSNSLPISAQAGLMAVQDAADPQTVQLFELATGQLRRRLVSPSPSKGVMAFGRFSPDGTVLAAQELGDISTVRFWNVETGDFITSLNDQDSPVWSSDGRFLTVFGPGQFKVTEGDSTWTTSGSRQASIVYEIATGAPTYRVASTIQALTFNHAGQRLAVQDTAWNVFQRHGGVRLSPAGPAVDIPAGLFVSSGDNLWARGKTGVAIPPSSAAKIWRVFPELREVPLAGVKRDEPGYIQNFAVNMDGRLALIEWVKMVPFQGNGMSMQGGIELWDLITQKRLKILEASKFGFYMSWPILEFSPDGRYLATKENNGNLCIWDSRAEKKLCEVGIQTELGPGYSVINIIRRVQFSTRGEFIFTATDKGRVDKIDIKTGKSLATWTAPDLEPQALAIDPAETMIAVASENQLIDLLDAVSGKVLARWQSHNVPISALAFSPDGKTLVSGARDGTIKLWDIPGIRKELQAVHLDW